MGRERGSFVVLRNEAGFFWIDLASICLGVISVGLFLRRGGGV